MQKHEQFEFKIPIKNQQTTIHKINEQQFTKSTKQILQNQQNNFLGFTKSGKLILQNQQNNFLGFTKFTKLISQNQQK